jgi:hypothetical protein
LIESRLVSSTATRTEYDKAISVSFSRNRLKYLHKYGQVTKIVVVRELSDECGTGGPCEESLTCSNPTETGRGQHVRMCESGSGCDSFLWVKREQLC